MKKLAPLSLAALLAAPASAQLRAQLGTPLSPIGSIAGSRATVSLQASPSAGLLSAMPAASAFSLAATPLAINAAPFSAAVSAPKDERTALIGSISNAAERGAIGRPAVGVISAAAGFSERKEETLTPAAQEEGPKWVSDDRVRRLMVAGRRGEPKVTKGWNSTRTDFSMERPDGRLLLVQEFWMGRHGRIEESFSRRLTFAYPGESGKTKTVSVDEDADGVIARPRGGDAAVFAKEFAVWNAAIGQVNDDAVRRLMVAGRKGEPKVDRRLNGTTTTFTVKGQDGAQLIVQEFWMGRHGRIEESFKRRMTFVKGMKSFVVDEDENGVISRPADEVAFERAFVGWAHQLGVRL